MDYLDNNSLKEDKIMRLLRSIFSEDINEQCAESEFPRKIMELKALRECIICLPFHQAIPDKIMHWVKCYFSENLLNENFYDFRHYSQRSFILAIDETIRTLEYDLATEDRIKQVDVSDIITKIMRD